MQQDPDIFYPGQGVVKQGITMFLYGGWGTWKTSFAGTFPKPVFLSVGTEGGDDALGLLPELYNIATPPTYHISGAAMMKQKVEYIAANYKALDYNTVVVDSIGFYTDLWVAELMDMRYRDPKIRARIEATGGAATIMDMRDWGVLAMHLRDLAVRLHNTSMNIIWIAGAKEVKEHNSQQGSTRVVAVEPLLQGQMAVKLPGMCKMIVYAASELVPDPNVPGRNKILPTFYTSPNYLARVVRHKYGNAFPEGRIADPDYYNLPTFRVFYERVGKYMYVT